MTDRYKALRMGTTNILVRNFKSNIQKPIRGGRYTKPVINIKYRLTNS